MIFVLTDGISNRGISPGIPAGQLKRARVTIFALGVTNKIRNRELLAIATSTRHVFHVANYAALYQVTKAIQGGNTILAKINSLINNLLHVVLNNMLQCCAATCQQLLSPTIVHDFSQSITIVQHRTTLLRQSSTSLFHQLLLHIVISRPYLVHVQYKSAYVQSIFFNRSLKEVPQRPDRLRRMWKEMQMRIRKTGQVLSTSKRVHRHDLRRKSSLHQHR